MRFRILSAALGSAAAVAFAMPALANHYHPSKANKFLSLFVQCYGQCQIADATLAHNPPLSFPACTAFPSGTLHFGAKGSAQATGAVKLNSAKQAADVQVTVKASDVRDPGNALFSGNLTVAGILRITDHDCTTPGDCTLLDVPFPIPLPCTSGKCLVKTSWNTVLAGMVTPSREANVELQQLQIYNGAELEFCAGLWLP